MKFFLTTRDEAIVLIKRIKSRMTKPFAHQLPFEIINHILSLRPSHPAAEIIRGAMEATRGRYDEGMNEYFENGGFIEIDANSSNGEYILKSLWEKDGDDEDLSVYSDRVLLDYHMIYISYGGEGIWSALSNETRREWNERR